MRTIKEYYTDIYDGSWCWKVAMQWLDGNGIAIWTPYAAEVVMLWDDVMMAVKKRRRKLIE